MVKLSYILIIEWSPETGLEKVHLTYVSFLNQLPNLDENPLNEWVSIHSVNVVTGGYSDVFVHDIFGSCIIVVIKSNHSTKVK